MFSIWMISEGKKSHRAFEEPKEVTLIDIVYMFVFSVHVTRIFIFQPFSRDLRIFLCDLIQIIRSKLLGYNKEGVCPT